MAELTAAHTDGRDRTGAAEVVEIVRDPAQTAARVQKVLRAAVADCVAVLWTQQMSEAVLEAHLRGVACRVLAEKGSADAGVIRRCRDAGVEVREFSRMPLKIVVADARGMLVLADAVTTNPQSTAIFFEHAGMAEAMKTVFDQAWQRSP